MSFWNRAFEVAVVKDATAAAQIPEGDGYLAALINFRFMANAVWTTDQGCRTNPRLINFLCGATECPQFGHPARRSIPHAKFGRTS